MTKTTFFKLVFTLFFCALTAASASGADRFPRDVSATTVDGSRLGFPQYSASASLDHRDVPFFFDTNAGSDPDDEEPQDDPWGFMDIFKPKRGR